jgi:tetratricopeptide (TPR) repeat protein
MAAYEKARDLSEAAFRADPNNALARQDYALGLGKIADLVASSDPRRSLDLSDQALAVLRQGASVDNTPHLEAGYYLSVAEPLRALGRPKEAEERLQQAMTILRPMITETPGAIAPQTDLAGAEAAIGELRSDAGLWRGAAGNYQRSLELQEPLGKAHPEDLRLQWQLAALYDNLALNASKAVAAHAGQAWTGDALRWRGKSVELWRAWLQRTPGSAYGQERLQMAESALQPDVPRARTVGQ